VTRSPHVTFVVPTYNLARFLPECLESIFAQTFEDFEVLVMDDCSPDAERDVVRLFDDPRLRYVRHPENVGHLRNYNEGIRLANGRYLWLISADDRLRRPYVLERFVKALDTHPEASFVFCPVVHLENAGETTCSGWREGSDRHLNGHSFLETLIRTNCLPTPAVMARTTAWRAAGGFPLDLPHAGDWYLWCVFALEGDVVALDEPMVNYRLHGANMHSEFAKRLDARNHDEIAVRWRILRLAEQRGLAGVVRVARESIAADYAFRMNGRYQDGQISLTGAGLEASLRAYCTSARERRWFHARTLMQLGDCLLQQSDRAGAGAQYRAALRHRPTDGTALAKLALLAAGRRGDSVRRSLGARA
jgi:glycosyltransferase involved in cell wall biosynthesis